MNLNYFLQGGVLLLQKCLFYVVSYYCERHLTDTDNENKVRRSDLREGETSKMFEPSNYLYP